MVSPTPSRRAVELPQYKSPHGPRYFYQTQFAGITMKSVTKTAVKSGIFGGVALFGVIFYASGMPRIQKDILQKVPIIGKRFVKEIPASDNPF